MDSAVTSNEKPDNLLWIERVILNNLEPLENLEEDGYMDHSGRGKFNQNDVKLMIAEIEMRDENYSEDDRIPTLCRVVGARIKFIIEGDEEERNHFWIIKIPSILAEERNLARVADVSKREICFYTEILPALKLWVESQYIDHLIEFKVPACYYGKFLRPNDLQPDLELIDHIVEAESILVIQDMRSVEFGKRYFGEGMCISEAMAAVAEIAKFHAVSYAMQLKSGESLRWKELYHWSDMVELYKILFHRGVIVFQNFLSNCADEPQAAEILSVITNLDLNCAHYFTFLLKPSQSFPNTLVHMDFWSDNLLFRINIDDKESGLPLDECDLECFIIDWQMVHLGRPSHDLALLIILSMTPEDRQKYTLILLQYYYQIFQKTVGWFEVEIPFTFGNLAEEFSNSTVLAVMMAIASMDIVMLEESTQTRLLSAIKDIIENGLLVPDPQR